jgi:outer membrane protein
MIMKKIITATLFSLAVCSNAIAASDLKIGYVSVEKLLTQAPQVEAVNTAMIERFGSKKDDLQKMENEIKSMQENYKRNELVMTEDKLDELKNKLIAKLQTFKQMEAALNQEVSTMRSQQLAILQKSVRYIINEIAKKEKYDLVLSEGVVFAADRLDITDVVLERMKKDFKK